MLTLYGIYLLQDRIPQPTLKLCLKSTLPGYIHVSHAVNITTERLTINMVAW